MFRNYNPTPCPFWVRSICWNMGRLSGALKNNLCGLTGFSSIEYSYFKSAENSIKQPSIFVTIMAENIKADKAK